MKNECLIILLMLLLPQCVLAAPSASISTNAKSIEKGEDVTVIVTLMDTAAWNIKISGSGAATCATRQVDVTDDAKNTTISFDLSCTSKSKGNVVFTVEGDITNENGETLNIHLLKNVMVIESNEIVATLAHVTYIYDGTAKTPSVEVSYGSVILEQDVDYEVSYSDNANAGSNAKVVITFKGNYAGIESITKTFTINKATINVPTCNNKTYTGNELVLFDAHTEGGYINSVLKGTNVGNYITILFLNSNYKWNDNTEDNKEVTCVIEQNVVSGSIVSKDNSKAKVNVSNVKINIEYGDTFNKGKISEYLTITGSEIVIKDADKNVVTNNNAVLGTGSEIIINGTTYTIVINGDATGDGKITALDYIAIRNHIMNTNKITNNYQFMAVDMNTDNKISALDYIKIRNIMMGV